MATAPLEPARNCTATACGGTSRSSRTSHVWLLGPTWIAINAAIGLWTTQSLFQLVRAPDPRFADQMLMGRFDPIAISAGLGVGLLIFFAGLIYWGNRFKSLRRTTIIFWGIVGGAVMIAAAVGINHSEGFAPMLGAALAVIAIAGLFVLAGATPAALGLLADISEAFPRDRGAIMGLYSVFLALGQIIGALVGGVAADSLGIDGLLARHPGAAGGGAPAAVPAAPLGAPGGHGSEHRSRARTGRNGAPQRHLRVLIRPRPAPARGYPYANSQRRTDDRPAAHHGAGVRPGARPVRVRQLHGQGHDRPGGGPVRPVCAGHPRRRGGRLGRRLGGPRRWRTRTGTSRPSSGTQCCARSIPGTMGGDQGKLPFVFAMLFTTFAGLFVVSALIGIINTGIEGKLTTLRKGRSRVIEENHTVILGWSQQVFTVVAELVDRQREPARRRGSSILADRDKVEMEDEICTCESPTPGARGSCAAPAAPSTSTTSRSRASTSSRSIIILSPDGDRQRPRRR